MLALTVATFVGNAAVLATLWRMRRAPAHYPLTSLALADLLIAVAVQPLAALRELFVFHLEWAICACWSTLDVLCCTASILSLCTLGWERWSSITKPLAISQRTRRAKVLAVLIWPVSLAVALPTAFVPSPETHIPGELPMACNVNINVGYVFFSITFSFYLPAIVMAALYGQILHALAVPPAIRAHRGRTPANVQCANTHIETCTTPARGEQLQIPALTPTRQHLGLTEGSISVLSRCSPSKSVAEQDGFMARQRRATRTIVRLMALFLICWTPFFIMLPINSLCECVWREISELCTWLGYVNSALNPLVYAAASPSVRRALHASLTSTSTIRCTDVPLTPTIQRA